MNFQLIKTTVHCNSLSINIQCNLYGIIDNYYRVHYSVNEEKIKMLKNILKAIKQQIQNEIISLHTYSMLAL